MVWWFVSAVAYYLCLNLQEAFSQPRTSIIFGLSRKIPYFLSTGYEEIHFEEACEEQEAGRPRYPVPGDRRGGQTGLATADLDPAQDQRVPSRRRHRRQRRWSPPKEGDEIPAAEPGLRENRTNSLP